MRANVSISSTDRPGDGAGPGRRLVLQVRFQLARAVRVFFQIRPVGVTIAKQHVHHRAGQRAVGAGLQAQGEVGLLHGAVAVDVDGDDLGAAFLAGADGVRHHVDLRVDGIGAPDHDEVGLGHLARIGTGELAGAGDVAGPGERRADRGMLAGIALGVPQALEPVAHDEAHGAGEVERPDRLAAVLGLDGVEARGDLVQRRVPADALELSRALRTDPLEGMQSAGRDGARARRSGRPWRR